VSVTHAERSGACWVATGLLVFGSLLAGCTGHPTQTATRPLAFPTPIAATHRVNVNGDLFTPEKPADPAAGQVAARHPWLVYSHGHPMPNGMIAVIGNLRASGIPPQNVWAFVSNSGCWAGYGPSPLPTPKSGYCTTWTFLNGSGGEIDETQQNAALPRG
jgi:hypothetical protein